MYYNSIMIGLLLILLFVSAIYSNMITFIIYIIVVIVSALVEIYKNPSFNRVLFYLIVFILFFIYVWILSTKKELFALPILKFYL